ncbi:ABC transporter permease [Membranihabitans maritimus]|uniref:ABC transporter permease n=1 Tax=Membranihabitans maritimus TaxID=2904244 RepID=UPI001F2A9929|nr:ABC transporter permease [Membranihabitans maritimus]
MGIKDLLELEWLKYRKNKLLWFSVVGFVVLLMGILMAYSQARVNGSDPSGGMMDLNRYLKFPKVWEFTGYIGGNWMAFFLDGFVGVYLIASEFSRKTARQQIISGLSRSRFVSAKLLDFLLFSIILSSIYFLVSIAFGMAYTGDVSWGSTVREGIFMAGRFALMNMVYITGAGLIALLLRKSALSMLIYMLYGLFLEVILRWYVHGKILSNETNRFYPFNAAEDLMPNPGREIFDMTGVGAEFPLYLEPGQAIVTSLIYLGIFVGLMYFIGSRTSV